MVVGPRKRSTSSAFCLLAYPTAPPLGRSPFLINWACLIFSLSLHWKLVLITLLLD